MPTEFQITIPGKPQDCLMKIAKFAYENNRDCITEGKVSLQIDMVFAKRGRSNILSIARNIEQNLRGVTCGLYRNESQIATYIVRSWEGSPCVMITLRPIE